MPDDLRSNLDAWEQQLTQEGFVLVISSAFKACRYIAKGKPNDAATEELPAELDVVFHDGKRWRYTGVPQEMYDAMMAPVAPDTTGVYFSREIRRGWDARPLRPVEPGEVTF